MFVSREGLFELLPAAIDACAGSPPPVVDVVVVAVLLGPKAQVGVVEHGADAAEELCVDEFARALGGREREREGIS